MNNETDEKNGKKRNVNVVTRSNVIIPNCTSTQYADPIGMAYRRRAFQIFYIVVCNDLFHTRMKRMCLYRFSLFLSTFFLYSAFPGDIRRHSVREIG